MKQHKYFCLGIVLLFPAVLYAGQIYGNVTSGGRGVSQAVVEINCAGVITKGLPPPMVLIESTFPRRDNARLRCQGTPAHLRRSCSPIPTRRSMTLT